MNNGNGIRGSKGPAVILISAAVILAVCIAAVRYISSGNEEAQQPEPTPQLSVTNIPKETQQPEEEDGSEKVKTYPSLEEADIPYVEKDIDIAALQADTNSDIYAWICIPDTNIDYPVLQNQEELDYYLDHNLDGSTGYPGCIYTQMMNSKDWSDKNTVIYGHNMKNGTMFSNLHYFEDYEFFDSHPYVYIYTEDSILAYRVFAAYECSDAHVLLFNDISTDEKYQKYLDNIFESSGMRDNFNTDVELTTADRIITLSTCISGKPDRRYLVQAVLAAKEKTD